MSWPARALLLKRQRNGTLCNITAEQEWLTLFTLLSIYRCWFLRLKVHMEGKILHVDLGEGMQLFWIWLAGLRERYVAYVLGMGGDVAGLNFHHSWPLTILTGADGNWCPTISGSLQLPHTHLIGYKVRSLPQFAPLPIRFSCDVILWLSNGSNMRWITPNLFAEYISLDICSKDRLCFSSPSGCNTVFRGMFALNGSPSGKKNKILYNFFKHEISQR